MIAGRVRRNRRGALLLIAVLMAGPAAAQVPSADPAVAALREEVAQLTAARNWTALVDTLTRLRAAADAANDPLLTAEACHRLGLAHQQLKAYGLARSDLNCALAIHVARGDRLNAGQLREALGLLAWTAGDAPGVRQNYGAAADDFAAVGRVDRQVGSLRNSTFAADMSVGERIAIVENAARLAGSINDAKTTGLVRHQLGDLLNLRGDYDRAIVELEAAVALLEAESALKAAALTSLGRTYRLHGLPDRAIEIYGRVLVLQRAAGDERGIAQTRDAMAVAYAASGRLGEAVAEFERALDAARQAGQQNMVLSITKNLAATLTDQGQPARAVALLEELLAAPLTAELEMRVHHSLAQAYRDLGRLDSARVEIDRAVTASEADPESLVQTLGDRAQIRRSQGDGPGAVGDATRALDVLETLRVRAAPRDAMKQAFVDQHRALFNLAIALQRDHHDGEAAFDIAERGRARAFQDLLASRDLRPPGARSAKGVELPSAAAVPPARVSAIRDTIRAVGTTVLAYWVAPEETTIWVIDRSGRVTVARVAVAAGRYETLARRVWQTSAPSSPTTKPRAGRATISLAARSGVSLNLGPDPRPALRELHRLLIAPVQSALPANTGLVTVIPHGPLFGVPFAALVDARNQYFVESYRLHYISSAAQLQPPPTSTVTTSRTALLIADPQPMPAEGGHLLAALPGARAEVGLVAALLPRDATTLLVGRDATESRVRGESGHRRAVHLATHGIVSDDRPFESYLALAPDAATGDDGRLTTSEVYGLSLNADLVVLSGCRTATGQLSGDGVHGLARAFFYAGTPSVVATLWDLPDAPAQHLFPELYRQWLAGSDKSAALRDAQLSLIRALRSGAISVQTAFGRVKVPEHPAVWASPVLLGQP
jgi:CHAT domain-containing protein/tetratricopeptide (TPR) repeat protein